MLPQGNYHRLKEFLINEEVANLMVTTRSSALSLAMTQKCGWNHKNVT